MPRYRRSVIRPQVQVGTYGIRQQARARSYAYRTKHGWSHRPRGSAMSFTVPYRHYVRGKPNTLKYYY